MNSYCCATSSGCYTALLLLCIDRTESHVPRLLGELIISAEGDNVSLFRLQLDLRPQVAKKMTI